MLLAIDPGPVESAFVVLSSDMSIYNAGKVRNNKMLLRMTDCGPTDCCIEMIASYGMPVGAEVFETCVWIGRFMEAWLTGIDSFPQDREPDRLTRNEVKNHLCHSSKANDATIRQALLDRFGGKERAIGRKASPGPLYGVSRDMWAALAVGVTWMDRRAYQSKVNMHDELFEVAK